MTTLPRPPRAALLALLALALLLSGCTLKQRVDQKVTQLNGLVAEARGHLQSYQGARADAERLRQAIKDDMGGDADGVLLTVDERLEEAQRGVAEVERLLAQVGSVPAVPAKPDAVFEVAIDTQIATARQAVLAGETFLADLSAIQTMFEELSDEWIRELLWFEHDGYWTSDENEYAAYNVCYYGERLSRRRDEGEPIEVLVSDDADRGIQSAFDSDRAGISWKYFTVADYIGLVNAGIVAPAPSTINSDTEAGTYLCGRNPQGGQYGALGEPPVTIEKAFGSMRMELSDEGSSFVGDERYGQWCRVGTDGTVQMIDPGQTPPSDAQWCWYQKPGGSTGYYWHRQRSGTSFIYIQSHRRCLYCTPTSTWSGADVIPDRQLASINKTDGSSLRGPGDQGGGPGTGK